MRIYRSLGELQRYVDSGGMMSRTFYVDAENGDDSNDGSSSAPFKTIKKACDSVPIGGYGEIRCKTDQTFSLSESIHLINKTIYLQRNGDNKPTINFETYIWDNQNCSYHITLRNSCLIINNFILNNAPKLDSSLDWGILGGVGVPLVVCGDSHYFGILSLKYCEINQTRDYFISSKHGFGMVTAISSIINFSEDASALINRDYGTVSLNIYNSTATSNYKWVANGTIGQNVITNLSSLDT